MTSGTPSVGVRSAQALVLFATLLVAGVVLHALTDSETRAGFAWVNHDVGNILYLGQRMRAGQRLYADFAEANPPAIFLVAEGIAALGSWLSISPLRLFHGLVVLLSAFGVAVIQWLYARSNRPIELAVSTGAYLLVLTGGISPADRALVGSFGQREQLFALAFVPYLLWRLTEHKPSAIIFVLSSLLGFLSSLKPHFAILFAALELLCWREDRVTLRRVGPFVAGGAALPYLLLVLHSPRSVAALWNETVPLHTRGIYAYFNQPFSLFWRSASHEWALVYALAAGYFLWSGARPSRRSVRAICVLGPLCYALVVQQHKFWVYHAIVLVSVLAVLSYGFGAGLVTRLRSDRAIPLFVLLLVALVVQNGFALAELHAMTREWKTERGVDTRLLKIAPLLAGRQRVLYYSTSIAHMRLAFFLGHQSVGRWNHELYYPSLVRDPDLERRKRSLARYCSDQRQLIAAEKPDAIVFHATRQGLESREQELLPLLVDQCKVVPAGYSKHTLAEVEEATVFLRVAQDVERPRR